MSNFVFQSLSSHFSFWKSVYKFSILLTYFEVFSFRFEKCIYNIELTSKISNIFTHILYLFKILDIGLLSRITIKMFCVICTILERMMDGGWVKHENSNLEVVLIPTLGQECAVGTLRAYKPFYGSNTQHYESNSAKQR